MRPPAAITLTLGLLAAASVISPTTTVAEALVSSTSRNDARSTTLDNSNTMTSINTPPVWTTNSADGYGSNKKMFPASSSVALTPSGRSRNDRQLEKRQRTEPSIIERQARRFTVFFVAARVYFDYQVAKWRTKRLEKKLGLPNDEYPEQEDVDRHPQILALWSDLHERNAARLTKYIQKLEGFWVKVGQYLSSRADIMPPEYLSHLVTLQDSLPPKPYEEIIATLEEELSPDERDRIVHLDPTPLSTASLAQVHRATVTVGEDGKDTADVVLKVQHRGVASLMRQDMENLRVILQLLAKMEPDSDFSPVINEYNQEVTNELDFRKEAKNMDEVRETLQAQNVEAIIPELIPGLVKERVLVMQFCKGFAVRDLEALDEFNVDRELLLERICTAWAVQMHVGGLFNADPHYGNILVSTDPDVASDASVPVLLDFGLSKRFDPHMTVAFARLMHASDETDMDALIQSFDEMGFKVDRKTQDPFYDMTAMQKSLRETAPQEESRQNAAESSKLNRERREAMKKEQKVEKLRNPVEAWPSEFVFFGRVTALLRGLCSRLGVRYPYLFTMAQAARKTLRDSIPEEERAAELVHPDSVRPTDTKINAELQSKLENAIKELDNSGDLLGLQLCVKSNGSTIANVAAGTLGTADSRPVTPSTLFNIFSTGKALLSIGMLKLIEDGKLDLDAPVSKYWPEFKHSEVTVRHVMTHKAGFANAFPQNPTLDSLLDWSTMKDFIAKNAEPEHPAGEKTMYHYLSFAWLCGGLIEAVTGRPYEEHLDSIMKLDDSNGALDMYMGGLPETVEKRQLATLSTERNDVKTSKSSDPHKAHNHAAAARQQPPVQNKKPKADEEDSESYKKVLTKYQGIQQLMNPSIFNMQKVRAAKLPSANIHSSAESLATVMDNLITHHRPLSKETLLMSREPQGNVTLTDQSTALLNDADANFGLGFQVHKFKQRTEDGEEPVTIRSIGHSGAGGSYVLGIPEANVSIAFTTNLLSMDSVARKKLTGVVFDSLGLEAPKSFSSR